MRCYNAAMNGGESIKETIDGRFEAQRRDLLAEVERLRGELSAFDDALDERTEAPDDEQGMA